jgi:two-component system, OmpR family, response regulator RegX3
MLPMLVFIIERDEKTASFLSEILEKAGFVVRIFRHRESLLQAALHEEPAVIILDETGSLRGLDDFGSLNSTRRIVLSARTAESEKVEALELGADDYITKPFSARELVARLRAVLRARQTQLPANKVLTTENLSIDVDARRAWVSKQELFLTATEFDLLLQFVRHPNRVLSRSELGAKLWPGENENGRIIDVYIHRLRQKIEFDPTHPVKLITCRGDGYMFVASKSCLSASFPSTPVPRGCGVLDPDHD